MLLQVAENGISYCGTLCACIGLAGKWSYWLMTGMVLVFLLQLLVWTYTWVIHPTMIHSRALWRYCQGTGTLASKGIGLLSLLGRDLVQGRLGRLSMSNVRSEEGDLTRGPLTFSLLTGLL